MSDTPGPLAANHCAGLRTQASQGCETRSADESIFLELRRKVQESELLSAATERLLLKMSFNGRLAVVVHSGRIFKSAYEEGYFRRKNDFGGT